MPECPICYSSAWNEVKEFSFTKYDCPRCGPWMVRLDEDLLTQIFAQWNAAESVRKRSRLSYILRRGQPGPTKLAEMPIDFDKSWHLEEPLPAPSEQLDQLIILVGQNQPSPAEYADLTAPAVAAWIGTIITRDPPNAGLHWLLEQKKTNELLERSAQNDSQLLRLKMAGWLRYGELMQGLVESRKVLMAMEFGDPELDHVLDTCFRPAVKRAGFELRIATDNQKAGMIDDQLRVALRTSLFVIADLTHRNNGAYWEAGFAEGLGRPVIYTCREAEWKQGHSHFDTNHLVTVIWDRENLEQAGARLTATIMATLPSAATLTE
jgi:hypothetical protein